MLLSDAPNQEAALGDKIGLKTERKIDEI